MSRDLKNQVLVIESKFARHLFWEFYALEQLWVKLGGGIESYGYSPIHSIIVNQSLRDKINFKFEEITDKFFNELKNALEYSIRSELKYPFGWNKDIPDRRAAISCGINYAFKTKHKAFQSFKQYLKKNAPYIDINKPVKDVPIWWGIVPFQWAGWYEDFCGSKWAAACRVWEESSNCQKLVSKIAWIDKTLDLEHNTGFLLNKTGFSALDSRSLNSELDNDLDARADLTNWISAIGDSKPVNLNVEISDDGRRRDNILIHINQETIPVSDWTRKVFMSQREKLV